MTQIKIKKARVFPSGEQFFPITHTKAVIDDNGYSVESRMQALQAVEESIPELQQALTLINNTLANKADIADVPTALSQLSQDSTHRVVTDAEKTAWNGKADKVTIVNHGTSDTTFTLTPNIFHVWGTVASLTLTLATPTDDTIVNEYTFQFTSGSTATTLSLPSTVVWDEEKGEISIEMGYIYQVSILNNIALWARVAV